MSEFEPSASATVHDSLNERTFEWLPEWQASYRWHAKEVGPGIISWDGLLLDGWWPHDEIAAHE
jgi:hypothetical protein